jgi:hypothetical protein
MMTNRPASTALVNRGDLAMCLPATRNIVAFASEFEQPRVASDPYHTVSLLAADE